MHISESHIEILEELENDGRITAHIYSHRKNTKNDTENVRFSELYNNGLIDKIGPDNSGLYEINEYGKALLDLKDEYRNATRDEKRGFFLRLENHISESDD